MSSKARVLLVTISLSVISLCLPSCSVKNYSLTAPKDFQMTATEKENKIPLRAALYIKPVSRITFGVITFDMGEAFSIGCERILKNIFRETILISQAQNQEFDVMLKPEIIRWGHGSLNRGFWVNMDVVWKISIPDGETIYFNTVKSEIESKGVSVLSTYETKVNDIMTVYILALNDQLLRAQEDIYSSKWWAKQWRK